MLHSCALVDADCIRGIGKGAAGVFLSPDELFDWQARITGWRRRLADDREIWKRISQGDADSFDAFYRENAPRLQLFLRQVTGNPQAAEDVAQETFTQLWSRPNGFQPERGTLRAYLYGIARKRAADWWRRQGPSDQASEDQMSVCQTETISIVGDAFRRLGVEQRTLLWLREVEGQSYEELALILEIPVGTVRSRLFAAREALRRIWLIPRQNPKEGA
jgi:RNA polymerase sigma-70 factor (ECF subfamily)